MWQWSKRIDHVMDICKHMTNIEEYLIGGN